jgi:hypothetical protein
LSLKEVDQISWSKKKTWIKKQKLGRYQRCWKLNEVYLNDTSLRFTVAPLEEQ